MDAYDGTMHFYVADPDDPIIRAYQGVFPTLFEPISAMPSDLRAAHPGARGAVQRPDPGLRSLSRDRSAPVLPARRPVDRPDRGPTSDTRLPSEAYYVEMHLPGETGVEFLLLQPMVPVSRPNMIAWVAARNDGAELRLHGRLPVPGRHDDLRTGPDRGPDRPGSDHQRPGHAVEPVGQQGHLRQPHRAPARRRPHLPPAGLPPVDRLGVPGLHPDRRRLAARGGLGVDAQRRPRSCCWQPRRAASHRSPPLPTPGPSPGASPGASPGPSATPGPVATPGRRRSPGCPTT